MMENETRYFCKKCGHEKVVVTQSDENGTEYYMEHKEQGYDELHDIEYCKAIPFDEKGEPADWICRCQDDSDEVEERLSEPS